MKHIKRIAIFTSLLLCTVAGANTPSRLLDAIEQVESGGKADAVGDNGNAVGSFQIWKIYVDDVNRILGEDRYTYSDRLSPILSREMVKVYIRHYATEKRLKREPTLQDMARIHNGGGNGYKKECTKKYWIKVKRSMKSWQKKNTN